MVTDSSRARFGRRSGLGAFTRKIAWLSALLVLIAAPVAQSAMLTNVAPRLPTNIGPRGPMIDSIGPRFDPSLHNGGNGGNNTGNSSNAGSSSGGSSANGTSGGSKNTKSPVVRRATSGVPPGNERRYFPDRVVFEMVGNPSTDFLNRHRLALLGTYRLSLLNTTIHNARILDGSSVPTKLRSMGADGSVRNLQPEYQFVTVADGTAPVEAPDAAQYAVAKLHLDEAHTLARGDNVLVAVIDSGIDVDHPALAGVVEKSFDALNSSEGPHAHGTALAGIIAGHNRLSGTAPEVHILGARAFSTTQGSTISIIASIDWAVSQGARVINMSFAGPQDPALGRALAAAHQKNVVLVAASGNAGPKSPPLWPAADSHVIAVTATDFDDHLYSMANRGSHVAIAAPGVDILVANPGAAYKMETGTSFSAGFVSGVAALILQRKPQLTPDAVKKVLLSTAHDLGPKGRDDQFGAGLLDAFQAVNAVEKPTEAVLQVPTR